MKTKRGQFLKGTTGAIFPDTALEVGGEQDTDRVSGEKRVGVIFDIHIKEGKDKLFVPHVLSIIVPS
jgi:hypothetical protein